MVALVGQYNELIFNQNLSAMKYRYKYFLYKGLLIVLYLFLMTHLDELMYLPPAS